MNIATLISAKELAALLQDAGNKKDDIVVLDCRFDLADPGAGARLFAQAHIPGALYIDLEKDLSAPKGEHGGRHPLPSVADAEAMFRRLGIGNTTTVIVYDERHAFASRCWWLLRYLGHDRVRVLNGGFAAWLRDDLPVSNTTHTPVAGHFTAQPRPQMLRSYAQVAALVDDEDARVTLIDSREADRFRGEREPIDPVAGHIPGAINVPWMTINSVDGNDDNTMLKPPSSQRARWQALMEQHPPQSAPWIVYCGSGVTGCANVLSLHLAGYGDVPLYAGSWSDWISYRDSPIAIGDE